MTKINTGGISDELLVFGNLLCSVTGGEAVVDRFQRHLHGAKDRRKTPTRLLFTEECWTKIFLRDKFVEA